MLASTTTPLVRLPIFLPSHFFFDLVLFLFFLLPDVRGLLFWIKVSIFRGFLELESVFMGSLGIMYCSFLPCLVRLSNSYSDVMETLKVGIFFHYFFPSFAIFVVSWFLSLFLFLRSCLTPAFFFFFCPFEKRSCFAIQFFRLNGTQGVFATGISLEHFAVIKCVPPP